MKHQASILVLAALTSCGAYIFLFYPFEMKKGADQKWKRQLVQLDSIEKISFQKEGILDSVLFNLNLRDTDSPSYMIPALQFKLVGCDTLFRANPQLLVYRQRLTKGSAIKLKYTQQDSISSIIDLWFGKSHVYTPQQHLNIEPPESGVVFLLMIFGVGFAALTVFILSLLIRFLIGRQALMEEIKMRYIQKKPMFPKHLTLLKSRIQSWDNTNALYCFVGVVLFIVAFFVPARFLGLREMLRHAHDGGGRESLAESIGYNYAFLAMGAIILLYLLEYLFKRNSLSNDLRIREMISVEGIIKEPYQDKKDGHKWKTTINIGKLEFEEFELEMNHSFKSKDKVVADIALQSMEILEINANSSKSNPSTPSSLVGQRLR
jgi:hypothetical protein